MAKKSVIVSICDTCKKEVTHDLPPKARGILDLPKGWIHLRVDDRSKSLMARDLCEECAKPIMTLIKQNGIS